MSGLRFKQTMLSIMKIDSLSVWDPLQITEREGLLQKIKFM